MKRLNMCALIFLSFAMAKQVFSAEPGCNFDKGNCNSANLINQIFLENLKIPEITTPQQPLGPKKISWRIVFTAPIPATDLVDIVKYTGVNPVELYYSQRAILGGYSVIRKESIEESLKEMLAMHKSFLAKAIAETGKDIAEATGVPVQQRLSILYEQLLFAQSQTNKHGIQIDAIDVDNSEVIGNLRKVKFVKSIAPARRSSREPGNADCDKDNVKSSYHETWAPYSGSSQVDQTQTWQTFYFNNLSEYNDVATYEHETQVYNTNFSDYAGYWSSNMPSAYYDTPFMDEIDNFTIGTFTAADLKTDTQYYTYMTLSPGTGSNSTVRIKGQKGHRSPGSCYSTWCVFADATTSSMAVISAPGNMNWQY